MKNWAFLLACLLNIISGCSSSTTPPGAKAIENLDKTKYLGKWYEIYRLPNWFEDGDCVTVTAEYSLRSDGGVSVLNTCHKEAKKEEAKGIGKIVEGSNNSKLRVSFFRPLLS